MVSILITFRLVPARGVYMETEINFALGFHEQWEAWLHQLRASRELAGTVLGAKEETRLLEEWLTRNRKTATKPTRCRPCTEAILAAVANGEDAFSCPKTARDALASYGLLEVIR